MKKKLVCAYILIFTLLAAIHSTAFADEGDLLYSDAVKNIPISKNTYEAIPDSFSPAPSNYGYMNGDTIILEKGETVTYTTDVTEEGYYYISLDFYPVDETISNHEIRVEINDVLQFREANSIRLYTQWMDESDALIDRYGNEVPPQQKMIRQWYATNLSDSKGIHNYPYAFYFEKGINTIKITSQHTNLIFGNISLIPNEEIQTYEEYLKSVPADVKVINTITEYEAEKIYSKNKTSILPEALRDPSITPYDSNHLKLNQIGWSYFYKAGDEVSWEITVPEDGFYYLTYKTKQKDPELVNASVFRTISIDGKVPFREVMNYSFEYAQKWTNEALSQNGEPFKFYLTKGAHIITMKVDNVLYRDVEQQIQDYILEINDLALQIKKITGNVSDKNREWILTDYLPNIPSDIERWKNGINEMYNYLSSFSEEETRIMALLKISERILANTSKDINDLPNQLSSLTEGGGSVIGTLSLANQHLNFQPLSIDKFYLHGDSELPKPEVNAFVKAVEYLKGFVNTFKSNSFEQSDNEDTQIDVWVNRNRFQIEILQQMTDAVFTKDTGIKVSFGVMPDEKKVVLANAAQINPDMALGLSSQLPYELAARGAAVDLSKMDGFYEISKNFVPGAFVSYLIDDMVCALPETQDFWVLYYRKDILDELGLDVPDTWDDVIKMLPTLRQYGMNFVTQLAAAAGQKPLTATLPFIWQNGGNILNANGKTTAIDEEPAINAMKFMTDLFTMYSMPPQVASFFADIKSGSSPIGISNYGTYLQLTFAGNELTGIWDIALLPGFERNGEVVRTAPGASTTCAIFENSDQKDEAWEFLKWYMSTEAQVMYSEWLYKISGEGNLWNSANLNAFSQLLIPDEHKEVILNQWDSLVEIPRVPGWYMIERELSNAWNKIVFDGSPVREAVDDSAIIINREIKRKMEELGYTLNGVDVKEYHVPTISDIESWYIK